MNPTELRVPHFPIIRLTERRQADIMEFNKIVDLIMYLTYHSKSALHFSYTLKAGDHLQPIALSLCSSQSPLTSISSHLLSCPHMLYSSLFQAPLPLQSHFSTYTTRRDTIMAISENIPGLDVTIEVDGIALPEYNDESACDKRFLCSSSKYVEAPPGAEFAIRYLFRPPFSPPFDVLMDILLDNQYVPVPYFEGGGKDGCEGYVYSKASMKKDGRDFMQKFRFTELSTGKSASNPLYTSRHTNIEL